ncbi:MAG: ABC transporter ATP-binding protein [Bdellovibrio sp.]|nr:ABC transporter ATP-binding protein [Bdellovibrio sp.]
MSSKIKVENLSVNYGLIKAVRSISFEFVSGHITSLIGSNGAGKSTTLKAISGLQPYTGEISFDDHGNMARLTAPQRLTLGIALCPEGRGIFPNLSVTENLYLGAYLNKSNKRVLELIDEQLVMFPRLAERRNQLAGTLSGGEQQMLAIARALMSQPKMLMLDEPSLGLAPIIIEQIFQKFVDLKNKGLGILLIEQNASLALEVSETAYVLETGEIILKGTGPELLKDSRVQESYLS